MCDVILCGGSGGGGGGFRMGSEPANCPTDLERGELQATRVRVSVGVGRWLRK